jgi:hypothetical protein
VVLYYPTTIFVEIPNYKHVQITVSAVGGKQAHRADDNAALGFVHTLANLVPGNQPQGHRLQGRMILGSSVYTRPLNGRVSGHGTRIPAGLDAEGSEGSDGSGLAAR